MIISGGVLMMSFEDKGTGSPDGISVMSTCALTSDLTLSTSDQTITANESSIGVTYQWLDCNNNNAIIPNENAQNFVAMANGDYACEITNGCAIDTTDCVVIDDLSVDEASAMMISVFPNPTSGVLNIKNGVGTARILDLTGKVILEATVINEQIDVSTLQNGIYLLQLKNEQRSRAVRFIKE